MEWLEKLFNLAVKAFALPGLHAVLTALAVGFAVTYTLTRPLPAWTPVKFAVQWSRVIIFFTTFATAVYLLPTPTVVAWGFMTAIMVPLVYEWVMAFFYHRYPWLKPKALLTANEMQVRVKEDPPVLGGD